MNRFMKGAMILTLAGIIVKVIGAVSKVILARILGAEGIGLYQMAYLLYQFIISIGAAGLPVALSIMVSRQLAEHNPLGARRTFRVATVTMAIVGALLSIVFYLVAPELISHHIIADERAELALKAVAPAIVVVSVLACFRGYFQGFQNMVPTGVSQVFEQSFRVITMLGLALYFLADGIIYAAAGAALASVAGVGAGLLVLIYFYYRSRRQEQALLQESPFVPASKRSIIKELCILTIPVAMANVMMPIVAAIDLIVVPNRLILAGYSPEQATTMFGYLTGMATSLISLPIIVTTSLASSLVPAISEAHTSGDHHQVRARIHRALQVASIITIPAFIGLCVLATPISKMMFNTVYAGPPMAIMSLSIWLLGLQQVTTGALQGLGRTALPMIHILIGSVVKVALNWYFTPIWGINGAAWATNIDFLVAAGLNLWALYRHTGYQLHYVVLAKIMFSALAMGGGAMLIYSFTHSVIGNTFSVSLAIMVAIMMYAVTLLIVRAIPRDEMVALPKIGKYADQVLRLWHKKGSK